MNRRLKWRRYPEREKTKPSKKEIIRKKAGLGDMWIGRRLSIDPDDGRIRSRLLAVAITVLAVPIVGFLMTSITVVLAKNPDAIPTVKAEKGPRVTTAKGEPVIVGLKNVGTFGPWNVFVDGRSSQKICYMITNAMNTGSKERVLRIEHAPSWNWFNQVKYQHGESLKDFTRVALQVIPKKHELLSVNGQNAWMEEERQHRFFNTQTGTNFYTAAEAKKDSIIANLPSFNFEGTACWVDPVIG